jgi:hypothetical protein
MKIKTVTLEIETDATNEELRKAVWTATAANSGGTVALYLFRSSAVRQVQVNTVRAPKAKKARRGK